MNIELSIVTNVNTFQVFLYQLHVLCSVSVGLESDLNFPVESKEMMETLVNLKRPLSMGRLHCPNLVKKFSGGWKGICKKNPTSR